MHALRRSRIAFSLDRLKQLRVRGFRHLGNLAVASGRQSVLSARDPMSRRTAILPPSQSQTTSMSNWATRVAEGVWRGKCLQPG